MFGGGEDVEGEFASHFDQSLESVEEVESVGLLGGFRRRFSGEMLCLAL